MDDYNKIYCAVSLSPYKGNNALFDYEEINNQFTGEVIKELKSIGVNCERHIIGGVGGGGEGLWNLIKFAWENQQYLQMIWFILSSVYLLLKNNINNFIFPRSDKPRLRVIFGQKIEREYNKEMGEVITKSLNDNLINLFNLSEYITKKLIVKYPLFLYDQDFYIRYNANSFSFNLSYYQENRNIINRFRLLNILRSIKIRKNYSYMIEFTKWFAISRVDRTTKYEDGSWIGLSDSKTYYFFLSNMILKDYFKT